MIDLEKWTTISRKKVFDGSPWITVFTETVQLPDGRIVDDFYQIDMPDYVIIYPETREGKILTLTQYKHGPQRVSLTFPGGYLEKDESPMHAAVRELLEETGYEAEDVVHIGSYQNSANFGCGTGHFMRAYGCQKIAEPNTDDLEEMKVTAISQAELWDFAKAGNLVMVDQIALLALCSQPELTGS